MEHLWWDLGLCTTGTDVEVKLRGVPAFVRLMDADHYQAYLDEDDYLYTGGVWEVSPVVLTVPTTTTGTSSSTATKAVSKSRSPRSLTEPRIF